MAVHAVLLLPFAAVVCGGQEIAPRNELGFTLGGIPSLSRSTSQQSVDLGSGIAFGVNYGRRIVSGNTVALYGEVDLLASPLRDVSSIISSATKNLTSLYVIPGVRLRYSRHPPFRRTRPSAVVTPTMSKVRLTFMVNPTLAVLLACRLFVFMAKRHARHGRMMPQIVVERR